MQTQEKEPTENIIWSWIPPEELKKHCDEMEILSDLAEEYRIQKLPDKFTGGVMVWGKYYGEWHANPNERYIIAELLRRMNVIKRNVGDL